MLDGRISYPVRDAHLTIVQPFHDPEFGQKQVYLETKVICIKMQINATLSVYRHRRLP
jgi:hypothetical protein